MNALINTGIRSDFNQTLPFQPSENRSLPVLDDVEPENRVRVVDFSASSSTTVTISGESQTSNTYASVSMQKSQAMGESQQQSQAATNILSFIGLRLQQDLADGATQEEIESRLQAGYEGFLKGYGEAFEELSAAGLLSPEVEQVIKETYNAVLSGIDELAEQYGVASPLTGTAGEQNDQQNELPSQPVGAEKTLSTNPAALATPQSAFTEFASQLVNEAETLSELLDASRVNYEAFAKRNFNFTLKTQDGDTVTISAAATRAESSYYDAQSSSASAQSYQSSAFQFDVVGELDEGELSAINDLLVQVGDLSETFFSGDIGQAFEMALEIGFDESEIARFSLNLRQEIYTKVESAYGAVQRLGDEGSDASGLGSLANQDTTLSRLAGFVKMLEDIVYQADALGIERSRVTEFADLLAKESAPASSQPESLQPLLDKLASFMPSAE